MKRRLTFIEMCGWCGIASLLIGIYQLVFPAVLSVDVIYTEVTMTISSSISKAVHVTNGGVTDYAFNFKVFHDSELSVTVVDPSDSSEAGLILAADFTVSGTGQDSGGAVILTGSGQAKAGTGKHLVILRNMPFVQGVDYQPHDIFPAETHERALDIAAMERQELREKLKRCIIAPPDQDENIQYGELAALKNVTLEARDQAASAAAESASDAVRAGEFADFAEGVVQEIHNLQATATSLDPGEEAAAHYDPATGVLSLGIPRGVQGVKGEDGKDGSGVNILDAFDDVSELPSTGNPGDGYLVGEDLYIWSAADNDWKNVGPIKGKDGRDGEDGKDGEDGPRYSPGNGGIEITADNEILLKVDPADENLSVSAAGLIFTGAGAPSPIKAWAYITGAGAIEKAQNVTSVTRVSAGVYRVYSPEIKTSGIGLLLGSIIDVGQAIHNVTELRSARTDGMMEIYTGTFSSNLDGDFTITILGE